MIPYASPAPTHGTGRVEALRSALVRMMANGIDITKAQVPILKVVGIVTTAIVLTWWARGVTSTVDQTASDVSEIRVIVSERTAENGANIRALEKQLGELETELWLLRDFTEGRIGEMPYRESKGDGP